MAKQIPYPGRSSYSRYARYRTPVTDRVNFFALLRRSMRMFRARWWIPLVTVTISSGIAIYYATTQPDTYEASSRLSIAPRVAFSARSGDRAVVTEERNNFGQAQMEYMRSSTLLAKVEEKLQEFRRPDGTKPERQLSVIQGHGSTFVMSVTSTDLEYARRFSRTWAQEFLSFKEDMLGDVARRSMDRTRTELSRQEEQTAEARQQLDDFLQEHKIATSQDTGNAAQALLVNLQDRLQSVMLQRQRLETKSAIELADDRADGQAVTVSGDSGAASDVTRLSGDAPSRAGSDPLEKFLDQSSYRSLKLRLNSIQAEMRKQSETLKPRHPYMVELKDAETEVERQIADQLALIDELRNARIVSLKQEEEFLQAQVETQRDEVIRLRDIHREYIRLTETLVGHKTRLDELAKDLQALSQIEASDEVFRILEEGVGSDRPVGPNRARVIGIGVGLGFVLGIGLVFLLHRLDDRVESAEELEKALDEPILGQIPMVSRRDMKDGLISIDHLSANNIFVEAFRGVRSSLMFGDLGGSKQVLMVTSSVPGDGKSTFTVNFAITLAKAGNRVLLVDADLRRGTVSQYLGVPREPGLSEILSGVERWTDVLHETEHRTLLAITSGKAVENPGELLLSKVIRRFVEEARGDFDYIIFDSPPVVGMDDAASLGSNCDGLVFVYRVGATSLKLAKLAVNTTRQRGGRILGLILNGVTLGNTDYYYTAYYYSHYAYGQRAVRPAGTEGEPPRARPGGARLLAAMRDQANVAGGVLAPHAALLDEETGPGNDGNGTPTPPPPGEDRGTDHPPTAAS